MGVSSEKNEAKKPPCSSFRRISKYPWMVKKKTGQRSPVNLLCVPENRQILGDPFIFLRIKQNNLIYIIIYSIYIYTCKYIRINIYGEILMINAYNIYLYNIYLVGGWTNPLEKYARQIGSFPQGSGWKFQKYLSCHHLDTDRVNEKNVSVTAEKLGIESTGSPRVQG